MTQVPYRRRILIGIGPGFAERNPPSILREPRSTPPSRIQPVIYVDADACPVKDEIYRVARRFRVKVIVAVNNPLQVPAHDLIELVVKTGFGGVDDWIAETCGLGDIVVTVDIPLAARALLRGASVLDHRGRAFTENDIGEALANRELMNDLRASGEATGGPAPFTAKDRSRFLSKLDETLHAIRRAAK
jgi:uncharacterized protein